MSLAANDAWIEEEPRLAGAVAEVLARAARRPWRVVGVAVLGAALLLGLRVLRPPSYLATVTFRMEEGDGGRRPLDPRPPARIREYIWEVALTRSRVLELMERHDLSRRLRAADPVQAAESFREDVEVDVNRNFFLLDRESAGAPRSATVVVGYRSGDPEVARAVAADLGDLFLGIQGESRVAWLERGRDAAAQEGRRIEAQLAALEGERAVREAGADAEAIAGQRGAVVRAMAGLMARAGTVRRRLADLDVALARERHRVGLALRRVDESVVTVRAPLTWASATAWATAVLAALLPLSAIVLGAFDGRIHGPGDLSARGIPFLATLPLSAGAAPRPSGPGPAPSSREPAKR